MNDGQTKVAQMALRAKAFADSKVASDFTHAPMTAVDNMHAAALTKLDGAITGLGGEEAIQGGGGFSEKTTEKGTNRSELEDLVKQTNRTAAAIAEEQNRPEIMDSFRMPHGSGDEALKLRALSMANAIGSLTLDADFAAHGLANHATTLSTAANNFTASVGEQGTALGAQVGATAMIPIHLKSVKSAVKTCDAIYHNVFVSQADVLGAWKSQSHIEKVGVRKKKTPPAPAPAHP